MMCMPPLIDVIFLQGSFGKKVAFDGGSKGVVSFSSSFKRTALKNNVTSGLASASSGQPITKSIYDSMKIYPFSPSSTVSVLGESRARETWLRHDAHR